MHPKYYTEHARYPNDSLNDLHAFATKIYTSAESVWYVLCWLWQSARVSSKMKYESQEFDFSILSLAHEVVTFTWRFVVNCQAIIAEMKRQGALLRLNTMRLQNSVEVELDWTVARTLKKDKNVRKLDSWWPIYAFFACPFSIMLLPSSDKKWQVSGAGRGR